MVFQCHRCFYVSKNRKDMKKHLNRKNKCLRIIDSYNFNENIIDELSLKNISEDKIIQKKNMSSLLKKKILENEILVEDKQKIFNDVNQSSLNVLNLENNNFKKNEVLNYVQLKNKLEEMSKKNNFTDLINHCESISSNQHILSSESFIHNHENSDENSDEKLDENSDENSNVNSNINYNNNYDIKYKDNNIINNKLKEDNNCQLFDNDYQYIKFIKKNNIIECLYCKRSFYRKYELIRHIQNNCSKKEQYIEQHKNIPFLKNKSIYKNDNNNYNINNTTFNNMNHTINNQQINNISINVYNKDNNNNSKIYKIPFDKEWDLSNIDHQKKLLLFLSDNKYSNTMEEILKNDKNKNVLFDDENDSGLVYQDDKFINMGSDEIIIKMMYKLYNHLNTFYNEIKNNNYINCDLDKHKDTLEEKYNNFNQNKDNITKEVVKNILIDIFHNNKEKIIKQFLEFNKYLSEEENKKSGY